MTDLTVINAAGNPVVFNEIDNSMTKVFEASGLLRIQHKRGDDWVVTYYAPGAWRTTEVVADEEEPAKRYTR